MIDDGRGSREWARWIVRCEKALTSKAGKRTQAYYHELILDRTLEQIRSKPDSSISHAWIRLNGEEGRFRWYKVSEGLKKGTQSYIAAMEFSRLALKRGDGVMIVVPEERQKTDPEKPVPEFIPLFLDEGERVRLDAPLVPDDWDPEPFRKRMRLTHEIDDYEEGHAVPTLEGFDTDILHNFYILRFFMNQCMTPGRKDRHPVDVDGVGFDERNGRSVIYEIKRKTPIPGFILNFRNGAFSEPDSSKLRVELEDMTKLEKQINEDERFAEMADRKWREAPEKTPYSVSRECLRELYDLDIAQGVRGRRLYGLDLSHVKTVVWCSENDISYRYIVIEADDKQGLEVIYGKLRDSLQAGIPRGVKSIENAAPVGFTFTLPHDSGTWNKGTRLQFVYDFSEDVHGG